MGRKVNTAWFSTYRAAEHALAAAISAGESRAEETHLQANNAGMKGQSFARLMKAGRFLDSHVHHLEPESIRCSYVQIETLERIARIAPDTAKKKIKAVIANEVSLAELEQVLVQLKVDNPVAQAVVTRDSTRKFTALHERNCAEAIIKAGPAFFGVVGGKIFKQARAREYISPPYIVMDAEQPRASVYPRIGGQSKSPLAVAFELYDLACSRRDFTPQIWFIFPEFSEVFKHLAYLAFRLGGAPDSGNWLKLATLSGADEPMEELPDNMYGGIALEFDLILGGSLEPDFAWHGKSLQTGDPLTIESYKPLVNRNTRTG